MRERRVRGREWTKFIQGDVAKIDERSKWAFGYAIDGDLKFISHHDTLRLFRRAFARAELPVRYSEGFNPHPRMTIPLPRPVGIASDDETIVLELTREVDAEETLRQLQRQAPTGLAIRNVRKLAVGERLVPDIVRYRFISEGDAPVDTPERIRRVLESAELTVTRIAPKGGQVTKLDVRPYLVECDANGGHIDFALRVTGTGTARPSEILGLLGFEAGNINHRIRRLEVQWQ